MNPPRLKWTKIYTSETPPERESAASVVYQDKLYIHGGYGLSGCLNDFWYYNFETETFHQIKVLSSIKPSPRKGHSIVVVEKENAIYLFGGVVGDDIKNGTVLNDFWKYDIQTMNWTEIRQDKCPSPRHGFGLFVHDTKLFVFSGQQTTWNPPHKSHVTPEQCVNDLYAFDFEYQTWTQIKTKGTGVCDCYFAWIKHGKNLYVHGGQASSRTVNHFQWSNFFQLNLDDFRWSLLDCLSSPPSNRFGHSFLMNDKCFVCLGGMWSYPDLYRATCFEVFCYDIIVKIWTKVLSKEENRPSHRSHLVAQTYKNDIYIFGGLGDGGLLSNNDLYKLQVSPCTNQDTRVASDICELIRNPESADICFLVEGKRINLHKSILCARSEYFQKILKDQNSDLRNHEIKIDDGTSSITFMKVIEFLYSGKIENFDIDIAMDVLVAAKMYKMNDLILFCIKAIENVEITTKTAIDMLILSHRYNVEILKNATIKFIVLNWNDPNIKINLKKVNDIKLLQEVVVHKK